MLSACSFLRPLKRTTYLLQKSFAAVTVTQIKELRNMTGSSIDECKKALEAENGDMEKAKEFLKKRGLAQAIKKGARTASEGVIGVKFSQDRSTAIIAEVNCETDFVAKNELFLRYVNLLLTNVVRLPNLASLNFNKYESSVEEEINNVLKTPLGEKISIEGHECGDLFEAKQLTISKIQENIKVRRLFAFNRVNPSHPGAIGHYVHMTLDNDIGKACCFLDLECNTQHKGELEAVANNIAMQLLGTKPDYLKREDIPANIMQEEIEKVKESLKDALKNKPQNVVDKMVEGKLRKFLEDTVLEYQEYMVENDSGKTVGEYLKEQAKVLGGDVKLNKFQIVATGSDA